MKKRTLNGLLVIVMTIVLWGCYPQGPDYYSDYDIVYTNYDNTFIFAGNVTYAMPDNIVKITDDLANGGAPTFVNSVYATPMLSRIKANMTALGYTLVTDSTTADFFLLPSAIEVTNISYYYDYWGSYWGYWGGYYYPYPVTYSYKTGSLFMNLVDRNEVSADGKRRIVWTGIINGLLEGTSADFTNRMNNSINQAFTQSQYLHQ
jgi:hypothetical protein